MDEEYDDARQYLKSLATKITEEKNSLPDHLITIKLQINAFKVQR